MSTFTIQAVYSENSAFLPFFFLLLTISCFYLYIPLAVPYAVVRS